MNTNDITVCDNTDNEDSTRSGTTSYTRSDDDDSIYRSNILMCWTVKKKDIIEDTIRSDKVISKCSFQRNVFCRGTSLNDAIKDNEGKRNTNKNGTDNNILDTPMPLMRNNHQSGKSFLQNLSDTLFYK